MKLKLVASLLLFFGLSAEATQTIKINLNKNLSKMTSSSVEKLGHTFVKFNFNGIETDRTLGAPELPVKSLLVRGTPSQLIVRLKSNTIENFAGTPFPVQEQDCRCATEKVKAFQFKSDLYSKNAERVSVNYLGAYRGEPISMVEVRLGAFNSQTNQVEIITNAEIALNTGEFSLPKTADLKDYLIVTTAALASGANDFINWKRSQGFNVSVETVASPNNTTDAIQALIRKYYTEKSADFVMIIGDETTIPMFKVNTSGSAQTPSDLPYFTMDGAQDYVPDVFGGRIVASTPAQVNAQLAKSIEFEQHAFASHGGMNKFIGIASNQGSAPSDDEYIKSIEDKYKEVLNSEVTHLAQNDVANSKPAVLNANLNSGASWLTYVGHGSGTSWPSMNQQYTTANVLQLSNKGSIKPIIIDVACQNGRLISSNLGSTFMRADGSAFGAVAYYGGSVNVSWNPPAIMAQGIAFEHLTKKYNFLGQALLAGQLYLAGKWTKQEEVVDNFEWYHLQGDPGLNISF